MKGHRYSSWLQQSLASENVYERWLGKFSVCVAWLGLLLAVVTPPQGTGFTICWFQTGTGLPCVGCGLTRSLSCALRGMFVESWNYHPFGVLLLGLLLIISATSLLDAKRRQSLASYMQSHAASFNALYFSLTLAFILFGICRALLHLFS